MAKTKATLGICGGRTGHNFSVFPCRKPGKYVVNGKPFCKVHDPEKYTRVPDGKVATKLWVAGFDRYATPDEPSPPPFVEQVTAITHGTQWRIIKHSAESRSWLRFRTMVGKAEDKLFPTREEAIDNAMRELQEKIEELEKQFDFARAQKELLMELLRREVK